LLLVFYSLRRFAAFCSVFPVQIPLCYLCALL
jgi:hypothetical protein